MPDIDVTDILTDPDIAGSAFTVIRRQETVNTFGESVIATTTYPPTLPKPFGAIYPTGDNKLQRQVDFSTQADTITVVTKFRLRGASKDAGNKFQPDIVVWKGNNYVVSNVNEFTQYGAGFIEAECTSKDFTVQAPT